MNKKMIAVIFGGMSPEYPVSLKSAAAVLEQLDRSRYLPLMIGISREGSWFCYEGDIRFIREDTWLERGDCCPALLSPSRRDGGFLIFRKDRTDHCRPDAILPILHGQNGEDGTIQGLAALAGIPLAGCKVLSSALCMDKYRAHLLAAAAGAEVPRSRLFDRSACEAHPEDAVSFAEKTGFPVFVKPLRAGSSFGITRVCRPSELPGALELAFRYDSQILLEEHVEGFEVGCAVLGREELFTGAVDEIQLSEGFFDFTEKYTLKTSSIHVPARIPPEKAAEIQETARMLYRLFDCSGFARVDLFLTPEGRIVFNEINTIPGFTEHSRYPAMMKTAGLSFRELLTRIIESEVKHT